LVRVKSRAILKGRNLKKKINHVKNLEEKKTKSFDDSEEIRNPHTLHHGNLDEPVTERRKVRRTTD